ncbi:helix-turn-helix domain-containing protein [Streptomyces sp. DSM 41524]|uniref:Helix-turn-helix domain-containing protein n=1 Tax=Streptomyces asiaticus subsp. ignotus TaxID=3098222 RepID=A0ABU7PSR2_9ACTN|nr:helix-turn-helix domain-containing protein [Streptomyces sp. DSM 41524]
MLDIAKRAGLAKSTFFRHFQDKREVVFGEDPLTEHLTTAIATAHSGADPLEAVVFGFDALRRNVFTPAHRAFAVRRRAVIDAHPGLQEREALKGMNLTASITRAIAHRGAPALMARPLGVIGAFAHRSRVIRRTHLFVGTWHRRAAGRIWWWAAGGPPERMTRRWRCVRVPTGPRPASPGDGVPNRTGGPTPGRGRGRTG